MPRCKDCVFFDLEPLDPAPPGGNVNGYCRRRAPIDSFPWVKGETDWCGEFEAAEQGVPLFNLPEFQAWLTLQDRKGVADLQTDEDGKISGVLHLSGHGFQRLVFIKEKLMGDGIDLENISYTGVTSG